MRRSFCILTIALAAFFAPSAHAMVLKDVEAQPGVPRTGVIIVAVSSYIGTWESTELGTFVVVDDAYAKRLADPFLAKPGVHYVALLTGSEATASGILTALKNAADEHLDFLVFSYRGFGLGADVRESCFAAADWDHDDPFQSCLSVNEVAPLVTAAAKRRLVLLDASTPSKAITDEVDADTFGPTADDWPVQNDPDTTIVSSGRTQKYTACNTFSPMIAAIVKAIPPEAAVTYGDLTAGLSAIASSPPDKLPQGITPCTTPLQPSFDGTWFSDVVLVPAVEVATTPEVVTVAPHPLPRKATKKIGPPTIASLITTGVCTAVGVGSWAYGAHRLEEYNDPAWAEEHFPGNDGARIAAGQEEIPTYGYLALGGLSCAGVGAAASGLTWYFDMK